MNIREMIEFHIERGAQVTVSAIPVEKEQAVEFGVVETKEDGRIAGFHEKRSDAPTMPGDPNRVYASMGNYIFSTKLLLDELRADGENESQLARFRPQHSARSDRPRRHVRLRFPDQPDSGRSGRARPSTGATSALIDAFFDANMDLRAVSPELNLYNRQWPLRTAGYFDAPAKFIFDADGRRGQALDSIVSGGAILSGGLVRTSVIGRGVRVHSHAYVEDSIIFDNCDIGRRARVRRAILDKNVHVPPDATIGYDLERDRQLYHVTDSGIVVVEGHRSPVDIASMNL